MPHAETTALGKYRLIAELGSGGMARVYLALALGPVGFQKLVVIKQIQPDLADDGEFVSMFLDEARLAARLNHPNVVQTNEVGCVDGRYFIAMEYLEGQSFRRVLGRLARGAPAPLTLGMALRVVIESLAGLHHAHELCDYDGTPLGVVHRDINPHNIFVTYAGQVKVVDFGIAKAFNSATETRTGVLKGKVAYMSPEQAAGERVDRRADVFSVGMMLWEIAVGRRMFKGMPDLAVLKRLIQREIEPPRVARPDVPERLEQIILRALAPDPEERYSTARTLSADLEDFVRELGDGATTREVGEMVAQHFADDRARVQTLIEAQSHSEDMHIDALPMIDLPLSRASGSGAASDTPSSGRIPTASSRRASDAEGATVRTSPEALRTEDPAPSSAPPASTGPPVMHGQLSGTPTHANLELLGAGAPARSRAWLWVAAALLIVGSGAAYSLTRSGAGANDAAPSSRASATVRLRIDSRPPGASVRCGESSLGQTPVAIELAPGAAPCRYRLELAGFEPYELDQPPLTSDTTVLASLVPLAATAPSATAEPSARDDKVQVRKQTVRPHASTAPPPPPPPPLDIRISR